MTKVETWRSERYLAWVRSLPCCMTGEEGCEAHHVIGIGYGLSGGGMKAPDSFVMPLTPLAHRQVHQSGALQQCQPEWLKETIRAGLVRFAGDAGTCRALKEALTFIESREREA